MKENCKFLDDCRKPRQECTNSCPYYTPARGNYDITTRRELEILAEVSKEAA